MFKDLYQLSRNGELAKMKDKLEETLNNGSNKSDLGEQSPMVN